MLIYDVKKQLFLKPSNCSPIGGAIDEVIVCGIHENDKIQPRTRYYSHKSTTLLSVNRKNLFTSSPYIRDFHFRYNVLIETNEKVHSV